MVRGVTILRVKRWFAVNSSEITLILQSAHSDVKLGPARATWKWKQSLYYAEVCCELAGHLSPRRRAL